MTAKIRLICLCADMTHSLAGTKCLLLLHRAFHKKKNKKQHPEYNYQHELCFTVSVIVIKEACVCSACLRFPLKPIIAVCSRDI